MRYTFCSRCGAKKLQNTKCSCKPEQTRDRKEYLKKYYKENDRELGTTRWKLKRKEIIERDGCCQRCLILFNEVVVFNLQVHHIKPRAKKEYRHLMFDNSNLITLCEDCNKFYNGIDPETKKQWERLDFEWKEPTEARIDFS